MPGCFVQNTATKKAGVEKENICKSSPLFQKSEGLKGTGMNLSTTSKEEEAICVNKNEERKETVQEPERPSSSITIWKSKIPVAVTDGDPPPKDKLAVLGFRFGIGATLLLLAIFTYYSGLLMLGLIFALLALVMGIIAWKRIKRNPDTRSGRWLALVAIIMGSFFILCLSWFFVFWGLYFNV